MNSLWWPFWPKISIFLAIILFLLLSKAYCMPGVLHI